MTETMMKKNSAAAMNPIAAAVGALPSAESDAALDMVKRAAPLRCPLCHRKVFSSSNGILRLRTRILIFDGCRAIAKCKYCRSDITVPIVISDFDSEDLLPPWDSELHGKVG